MLLRTAKLFDEHKSKIQCFYDTYHPDNQSDFFPHYVYVIYVQI